MNKSKLDQQARFGMLNTLVNERITTAMKEEGLSIPEIASQVGMSVSTLRRRLSGKGQQCFYVSELALMAVYLDRDLPWIFGADAVAA